MCVFLFDRLEEQSIRLHNIEDALMRTVSILVSVKDQEFSAASAALKSDPLLNSLLTADAYDSVESILLRSDQVSNSLESPIKGIIAWRSNWLSRKYLAFPYLLKKFKIFIADRDVMQVEKSDKLKDNICHQKKDWSKL